MSTLSLIAATTGDVTKAGKAIALALGIGLGSLGPASASATSSAR